MPEIRIAVSDRDIESCFAVLSVLRPHIQREIFVDQVRRLGGDGYKLVMLTDQGQVKVVAGFRICESLAWGRYLYVDDLVCAEGERSKGYGGMMFDWLVNHAREQGCDQMHLESGVQRFGAHKFYLVKGMNISSHHFHMSLR